MLKVFSPPNPQTGHHPDELQIFRAITFTHFSPERPSLTSDVMKFSIISTSFNEFSSSAIDSSVWQLKPVPYKAH